MFGRGNSRKRVSTLDAKIMWEERHEADRIRKNSRPAKEAGVADEPKNVAKRAKVKPATFPVSPAPQPPMMQPPLPVEPVAPQATNAMVQASVPAAMLPGSKADGTFKRPMNAFILFSNAKRAELSRLNPTLANNEISRLLGEEWRNLSAHEKSPFVAAAKKIKGVYFGDELLGGGWSVSNLTEIITMVKDTWPDGVTYYNEEWEPINNPEWTDSDGQPYGKVPPALDLISYDVSCASQACVAQSVPRV